jgi:hypothetical protein
MTVYIQHGHQYSRYCAEVLILLIRVRIKSNSVNAQRLGDFLLLHLGG